MAEAWHDALCASVRNASTGTLGALKATAVAEKTADEAVRRAHLTELQKQADAHVSESDWYI
jgi:hypothetical protein